MHTEADAEAEPDFLFAPPPAAEAGWLVCRRVQRDDATDLYRAVSASIDHLRPWMPWVADGYSRQEADAFTTRHSKAADDEPVAEAPYVVRDRDGQFLGVCGLHARLGPGALEIGYWVDVRHARRGVPPRGVPRQPGRPPAGRRPRLGGPPGNPVSSGRQTSTRCPTTR